MIYALLLAGGYGIRLWPMSRLKRPKQFLRLDDKESLLQRTVHRLSAFIPKERIYVVTLASQRRQMQRELPFLKPSQFIGEPFGKNTAAAIALGSSHILRKNPKAVISVFPCDHWIEKEAAFHRCLRQAVRRAAEGKSLVIFGVKPDRPETDYGYLEVDLKKGKRGLYPVRRFIEKPDLSKAKRLMASRAVFWNSGMVVFKASFLAELLKAKLPALAKLFSVDPETPSAKRSFNTLYAELPSVSFDIGILERFSKIECVRASFAWEDVGSWSSVVRHGRKDRDGNILWGKTFSVSARKNFIASDNKHLIGVFGISDLMVVHTKDATFICPKDRLGHLKEFVSALKQKKDLGAYL